MEQSLTPQIAAPVEEGENPFKRILFLPLLRLWPLVLVLAVVGAAGGTLLSLTLPNEFASVARVLVRFGEREQLPVDRVSDLGSGLARVTPTQVVNVLHILRARETFEMVARRVGPLRVLTPYDPAARDGAGTSWWLRELHELQSRWFRYCSDLPEEIPEDLPPEQRAAFEENAVRVAAQALQMRTQIGIARNSQIVEVVTIHHDPELSAEIANAFLAVFNERHLEAFRTDDQLRLIEQNLKNERSQRRARNTELIQFRDRYGIVDLVEERTSLLHERIRVDGLVQEAASGERHFKAELVKAQAELERTPARLTQTRTLAPVPNSLHTEQREYVLALEREYQQLLERVTEESEEAREKFAVLAREREKLAGIAELLPAHSYQEEVENPAYPPLSDRVNDYAERARRHASERESAETRLAEITRRLDVLKGCEPELESLQSEVARHDQAVEKYEALRKQLEVAQELDKMGKSNLKVVQYARPPLEKAGPQRMKFVVVGVAFGLFLGLALVCLCGLVDRTVRREADLEELGVNVLAVVPASTGWKRARKVARRTPLESTVHEPTPQS